MPPTSEITARWSAHWRARTAPTRSSAARASMEPTAGSRARVLTVAVVAVSTAIALGSAAMIGRSSQRAS